MGDLTKCRSSVERPSAGAGTPPADACGASTEPGTIISGAAITRGAATTTPAEVLRSRICRSPLEYSNSSRLCSVMNWKSCSICSISGLANDGLDLLGFLRFMPVLDLYEIPRCAGQYFRTVSLNGDVVLDANSSDACRIHTGF